MKKTLIYSLLLLICMSVSAQTENKSFLKKVGTLLDSMSVKNLDRNYIDAPEKPWQVIVRGNVNQSVVSMTSEGTIVGLRFDINPYMKTEPSLYTGLWAGYRGYGVGYMKNIAGDKGSYFTIGATGGSYGVNVRIHSFNHSNPELNLRCDIIPEEYKDEWKTVQLQDPIKVNTVIADGYYFFNGRRFSYAAAYDQSVIQKRSAGSFMAGVMYYYGKIDYASDINGDLVFSMNGLGRVKLSQGSVGVGYAYNWVPVRGLLVNAQAMPMLTFYNKIKAYAYETNVEELIHSPVYDSDISDEEWDKWWDENIWVKPLGNRTYSSGMKLNFNARLSVTYNFNRFFVNAYGQFNNMRFSHEKTYGHLNDWYVYTSFGLRL